AERLELCSIAAEIAELLAVAPNLPPPNQKRMRLRAALLYELGSQPAMTKAVLNAHDTSVFLQSLFMRKWISAHLNVNGELHKAGRRLDMDSGTELNRALSLDAFALARYEQGEIDRLGNLISNKLAVVATELALEMSATELKAFASVISQRAFYATR